MDQSTPQQPSRKKTILSLTVLVVLTGIVFWIFQRHWAEISAALHSCASGRCCSCWLWA